MITTTPDVNVIEINLPGTIATYTVLSPNTSFTMVLNARLTWERRMQAYKHEIEHIMNGDYDGYDADRIELRAHGVRNSIEL